MRTPNTSHVRLVILSSGLLLLACGDSRDGPDDGGVGPVDAGPFEGCEGIAIEMDGVIDFDLRSDPMGPMMVTVSGTVTLDGAPFPDPGRGRITLQADAGGSVSADIDSFGIARYEATLAPGVYEIRYEAGECVEGGGPCSGGPILPSVEVRDDGVLDLDVRSARVSGVATLRGGAFPDALGGRGRLTFSTEEGSAAVALPSSGPATYAIRLMAGSYDVGFDGGGLSCASPAGIPCNEATIRPGVNLTADGVLDVDVRSVRVSGTVTVRGGPMPSESGDRGRVCFRTEDGSGACGESFGSGGAALYELVLVPGPYVASYEANAGLCASGAPELPCVDGAERAVNLDADGVFDLDLDPIRVSGRLTHRGATLPDELGDRGTLVFSTDAGSVTTGSFGANGEATYELTLLPGTYTVEFAANRGLCGPDSLPSGSPCMGTVLAEAQALTASGVLDFDVRTVAVSGSVTLAGAPLPDTGLGRGAVRFLREDGESLRVDITETGAATYAVRIPEGRYDLVYEAGSGCSVESRLPCNGGPVLSGVSLVSDGVLDVPLRAVAVRGRVTLRGALLPSASTDRGALTFALVDGDQISTPSFGPAGEASYELSLTPGRYVVRWDGRAAICGGGSGIPCIGYMLAGCAD